MFCRNWQKFLKKILIFWVNNPKNPNLAENWFTFLIFWDPLPPKIASCSPLNQGFGCWHISTLVQYPHSHLSCVISFWLLWLWIIPIYSYMTGIAFTSCLVGPFATDLDNYGIKMIPAYVRISCYSRGNFNHWKNFTYS